MPAILVDTAAAVLAALQAATFSQAIEPERSYADWHTVFSGEEAVGLRVDVVPVSRIKTELDGRASMGYTPQTDVVVRRKFSPADQQASDGRIKLDEIDALVLLVQEIHASLAARRLANFEDAGWEEEQLLAAYMPSHLRINRQFTGVVRVTHNVSKDLP